MIDANNLLELAAKATGLAHFSEDRDPYSPNFGQREWNPLVDDGDAMRLMLHCNLRIEYLPYCKVRIWGCGISVVEFWGAVGLEAATRLAIVKTAAEIGKMMKK
jgi:hypothetical protein